MKTFTGKVGSAVATVALVATSATPAMADNGRDRGGISTGDVIAGAVVLGGLAAILIAADDSDDKYNNSRRYDDRNDNRYGSNRYNVGRANVEKCVSAAESEARYYGRNARVTDIKDVDRKNGQLRVKGKIEVTQGGRYNRDIDRGNFTCYVRNGRVVSVDIDKISKPKRYGYNYNNDRYARR